jgi:signal transduction histidine kinase
LRRRVEALGGTLGVESGRREGTTVTAQWDAGVSAPAPATVATSPGPP